MGHLRLSIWSELSSACCNALTALKDFPDAHMYRLGAASVGSDDEVWEMADFSKFSVDGENQVSWTEGKE